MKVIKQIVSVLLVVGCFAGCQQEDPLAVSRYKGPSFVRFNLLLDNNGVPVEGVTDNSKIAVDQYNQKTVKVLKVPVLLTTAGLGQEPVTVDFSATVTGGFEGFTLSPASRQLSFSPGQLSDTIEVVFNQRWSAAQDTRIDLELTGVSDSSVGIGQPNNHYPNNRLSISLGEIETTCSFATTRAEITGEAGDQLVFEVVCANGVLAADLETEDLFMVRKGFDYVLERHPVQDGDTRIFYTLTLSEAINVDDVYFETAFLLRQTVLFSPVGNTILQVVKPLKIERDKNVNSAAHFYNLNDPFYRTYGESWLDGNNDGICDWNSFNAFTYPVVVSADHPAAVLYSDGGTPDPSDDVYHHAFRVGFNSPNVGNTTNPFNLKRWFNNESTNAANSPGFNIPEAIEFFPKDGSSQTEGKVLVIPQFITVAGTNGNSYVIGISGEGTYQEIAAGVFEIILEFRAENQELFGGVRKVQYHIYNTNSYSDPDPLTESCFQPIDL